MRYFASRLLLGVICWFCLVAGRCVEGRLAPHAIGSSLARVPRGGSGTPPTSPATTTAATPPSNPTESVLPETVPPPKEPVVPRPQPNPKWVNVRQRTLPAVVMLGALIAWVKLLGDKGAIALVFILQVLLYSEATTVVKVKGFSAFTKWWWFLYGCLGTSGCALMTDHANVLKLVSYYMATAGLVGFVADLNAPGNNADTFRAKLGEAAACHTALLVLVYTTSYWISTVKEFGLMWILYPALLVIINDTMAYVFGMLWGKNPLLPVISPKKTWEGFVGATVSTLALSVPLGKMLVSDDKSSLLLHALVLATYVSFVAPFGGFLASVTKRAHGEKDFGNLIPGHGGVVDRLDCQVVTAPFVYLWLKTML